MGLVRWLPSWNNMGMPDNEYNIYNDREIKQMKILEKLGLTINVEKAGVLIQIAGMTSKETQRYIIDNLELPKNKTLKTRRIVSDNLLKTEYCDINSWSSE